MSNVIINGEDRFSKEWLKGVTEKQAIQSLRANYPVNTIVKVWKIANGHSVPNYIDAEPTRLDELMKMSKSKLSAMAIEMEIDFESDANKKTIAKMIVDKESKV
jgi:hypothetical protein